ncbi:MAG: site-specific DNA-methyltransferase [Acidimicrobiales bacterium]|nr:site-specific DNA-methyltransferase [Acidimicrobiales bacterium]
MPELTYRIPNPSGWPDQWVDRIHCGDALDTLKQIPDECVALVVTSPPYWDIVDYGVEGQIGPGTYDAYLDDLLNVWREAERVLIPNGKLAIVTPIMPIPKSVIGDQHTRHLKNIGSDIEHSILGAIPTLHRFSLFIWQKQTTKKMFGSYPYPPNIYEDNTIEFIHVFVKDGTPPPIQPAAKEASTLSQEEWRNLTMQVWPMYPADVKRAGGHPAPYPVVLPQRLIRMYTFQADPESGFAGDIVLDMFNGSGATTVAARALRRRWIGIDLSAEFCRIAEKRTNFEEVDPSAILLEWPRVRSARSSSQGTLFDDLDT